MCRKWIYLTFFLCVLRVASNTSAELVAYWKFDEVSGTVAHDSSGNGLDGTLRGDAQWASGKIGGALDFDGSGDYVDCGNSELFDIVDELTVSAWVNIRSITAAWMTVIAKGDSAWRISVNNTTQGMHFGFENGTRGWQAANSTTELPLNEWHHVCGTYDLKNGGRIYIDGVLEGTNRDTLGITQSAYNVYIGENEQAVNRWWDGFIDDVQVYNHALTLEEIREMIRETMRSDTFIACDPDPPDGAMHGNTWVNLGWTPGTFAVSHDVYFGENFDDVDDGAPGSFLGNQGSTYFVIGFPEFSYPYGLNPDTTYYWRIDEVESDGTTKHKGKVWSFETLPDLLTTVLPVIGASSPGISEIDFILLDWLEENGFEAATIAIMKDRRLVYKKGYGWQNSDRTQPISPDAVMRLASNTKPITARAIKQLIEDRIIRAGDKVYQFLDIPPISGREIQDERIFDITIQHILDHKSGLIGNAPGTGQLGRMLGLNRPATMAETIAYTWTQNLLFTPGSNSHYSNLGYQILGHIVEKASGQTYEEYIREHIAQPLGITTFQVARNGMNNALPNEIWYAGQYFDFQEIDVYQSLGRVPQPYAIDMETRPGAGSLVSSAEDFCRFLKSYFHTGEPKPENLSGIIWTYTFFGSLPGTLTATRDIIKPNGSSIAYAVLVNERIDGRDDILPNLVSDLDAFLTNLESWPNIDLFLIEERIPAPPPPPPVTDALSEALDTALSFTSGGSADWFSQATTSRYGPEAAQSGDISHSQASWMQTTVSGTGVIKFYWRVSSEEDFDFLEFYIDDSLQDRISGFLVNWEQKWFTISTSGSHTLEWRYVKDGSGDFGSDCGWVDKVEWLAN